MSEKTLIHILYMEDDVAQARLVKKRLEHGFCQVDLAGNGAEGLELVARGSYDLVLVDYRMPVMDGLEVLRRLKEQDQAPPAVMLTGHGSEKLAVQAMKLGAFDYLVKDGDLGFLELLPMVIDQVLKRQQLLAEREEMLKEVRESEERYRKLVELSPDGIVVHCAGRFVFLNPAGAEILGVPCAEELLGHSVLDFIHPDYHQVFHERLRLLGGAHVELPWMEEKFLRADGSEVDVEVTALPFQWEEQEAFQIVFRDITERKADELRLERMAKYDALTGLPNRSFFFDRLQQLILHATRDQVRFALLYIDLDRFKEVNDQLGHYFGDLLLKEVALRLATCLRESDSVGRIGGDEFVVVLSRISSQFDAAAMADRITRAFEAPFEIQGHTCTLEASIGISLFPDDGDSKELLLVKADTAMYQGKQGGRDGIRFFGGEPGGRSRQLRLTRSGEPPQGVRPAGEQQRAVVS